MVQATGFTSPLSKKKKICRHDPTIRSILFSSHDSKHSSGQGGTSVVEHTHTACVRRKLIAGLGGGGGAQTESNRSRLSMRTLDRQTLTQKQHFFLLAAELVSEAKTHHPKSVVEVPSLFFYCLDYMLWKI